MMHMTLYWGKEVTLLFDSWKTGSWLSYTLTLLFCFVVSLFYQHLEALRLKLKLKPIIIPASSSDPFGASINAPLISPKLGRTRTGTRLASAVLFGVNSAIGYLIMLAIMSYNGGVLVAVVMGLSFGYFLFRTDDFGDADDVIADAETNSCACS